MFLHADGENKMLVVPTFESVMPILLSQPDRPRVPACQGLDMNPRWLGYLC